MFIPLKDCQTRDPELVGNKAINLSKLMEMVPKYGFEVPDGFVLDSSLTDFMPIVETKCHRNLKSWDMTLPLLKSRDMDPRGMVRWHVSKEMQGVVETYCREELVQSVPDIKQRIGEEEWIYFYVRSSSNISDTEEKTYAGAFESFPVVVSKIDETKLAKCLIAEYRSLFSMEALSQYLYNEQDISKVRLAVIFQELEDKTAAFSGLVRTKVKLERSSSGEGLHVMGVQGLGAAIMMMRMIYTIWPEALADLMLRDRQAGEVKISFEVDIWKEDSTFSIDEDTRVKRDQKLRKEVNLEKGWDVVTKPIPLEQQSAKLDDDTIKTLARMCKNVEAEFGRPLYIEFAVYNTAGGMRIQLVQARPIPGSIQIEQMS